MSKNAIQIASSPMYEVGSFLEINKLGNGKKVKINPTQSQFLALLCKIWLDKPNTLRSGKPLAEQVLLFKQASNISDLELYFQKAFRKGKELSPKLDVSSAYNLLCVMETLDLKDIAHNGLLEIYQKCQQIIESYTLNPSDGNDDDDSETKEGITRCATCGGQEFETVLRAKCKICRHEMDAEYLDDGYCPDCLPVFCEGCGKLTEAFMLTKGRCYECSKPSEDETPTFG